MLTEPPAQPRGSDLERRTRAHLAALDARDLTRRLAPPAGLDFCSNDYLGLASHPAVRARMAEAVLTGGAGATGSRLLRGEREAFDQIERRFAIFKGAPRALYFGSGYLANLGVLTALPEEGDVIFSDALNHASLIDGIRLSKATRRIFPHGDARELDRLLRTEPAAGQKFVVTESIFSMDGDAAPLADYAAICRAAGAALIVDEAHAVGMRGARGTGLIEEAGVAGDVLLSIDPCGKALGAAGAFVSGPDWAIEYLIQRARTFIFSTAPVPAIAAALDASLDIVESEPARRAALRERALLLRRRLTDAGVPVPAGSSPIIPIVLGSNDRALDAAAALQAAGFDVRAIRPPSVPEGTARLRVTVNVDLDEAALERFADAVAAAIRTPGIRDSETPGFLTHHGNPVS